MTGYKCGFRKIATTLEGQEFYIEINNREFSRYCTANTASIYGNSNIGFYDLSYEKRLAEINSHFNKLEINDWYVYKNYNGNRKELMYFSYIANEYIRNSINNELQLLHGITDGECDSINEELRNYLTEKGICSVL
jgi:hypothetical protein